MQFNIIFKTIFEYIHDKFCFVHTCTNTFCKYRKKLLASPRVHLVIHYLDYSIYLADLWQVSITFFISTSASAPLHSHFTNVTNDNPLHAETRESIALSWEAIASETAADPTMSKLLEVVSSGFPDVSRTEDSRIASFWIYRDALYVSDGVILYNDRVVIPPALRNNVLQILHAAHQGVSSLPQTETKEALRTRNGTVGLDIYKNFPRLINVGGGGGVEMLYCPTCVC